MTYDVVVVGAGLAGLTAALHLAERGLTVLILEADEAYPGGRLQGGEPMCLPPSPSAPEQPWCSASERRWCSASEQPWCSAPEQPWCSASERRWCSAPELPRCSASERRWCFTQEHGVHAIWSPYRNLQALWARHGIRPLLVPAQEEAWLLGKGRRVRRAPIGSAIRGSWVPAPLHYLGLFARPRFLALLSPADLLSLFPAFVTLLTALSIDPLAEDQPLYGLTLADVCRGWSPHMRALFTGLARNALPADPGEVPASGFFAFLRFYTLRRRDAWAFSYLPDPAPVTLIAPLVERLAAYSVELRLGARVTALAHPHAGDGWQLTWQGAVAPEGGRVSARAVVLAADAPATEQLLQASPATASYLASHPLRLPGGWETAVARLWFARPPRGSDPRAPGAEAGIFSGNFALDNFFWLHRIYNQYIRWARATGGSALEGHIYGPPELLARPDAALLAQVIGDVQRAWPELKGHLLHASLRRNPPTQTLLHAGRPEEHLGVETPWEGLYCCGDWVRDATPALFMERACVTGIKAANAVLRTRQLPPWSLLAHNPPEPLAWAVELQMQAFRAWLRRRRR